MGPEQAPSLCLSLIIHTCTPDSVHHCRGAEVVALETPLRGAAAAAAAHSARPENNRWNQLPWWRWLSGHCCASGLYGSTFGLQSAKDSSDFLIFTFVLQGWWLLPLAAAGRTKSVIWDTWWVLFSTSGGLKAGGTPAGSDFYASPLMSLFLRSEGPVCHAEVSNDLWSCKQKPGRVSQTINTTSIALHQSSGIFSSEFRSAARAGNFFFFNFKY